MENVIRTRPKRSLVRRLVVPFACLAVLAGGGWGAYQYYDSNVANTEENLDTLVAAHSAPATKEELKLLFSSEDTASKEESPIASTVEKAKPAKRNQSDRYAMVPVEPMQMPLEPPKLPPLVEKSAEQEPKQNKPVTDQATSLLGDRYAKALTSVKAPMAELHDAKETSKTTSPSDEADVARGQEPSANPLRTSSSPTASSDLDARAAFGAALNQAPKSELSKSAPSQTATASPQQLNNALQQARPLQPSPPASLSSNRYQTAAPRTSSPTPTPQLQSPAPPLEIQAPPTQQSRVPTPAANPFGAPPAQLRTAQQSAAPPKAVAPSPMPVASANPLEPIQGLTPTPGLANRPGTGRPGESLLEGAQSPSITIQKLSPEEIQVGKRCTFAIRVQNSGQRTAQNVQIRDEVPLGTELVGTAPRATVSGSEVVWNLGTLSPGEQRTVEMELLPREEGELGSVATVSLAAQASAKSRCTRPELALRLTAKPQVHVGEQQIVQIEISNPGSGDATGVMLLETVPTGVSHEAGPALEFEVGTLRAGEHRRMELMLTAEQAGKISNVMMARADASLQVEASCEFEVIAPELQLSIEGPQRRFLERPATYRVSIDNPGTAAAKDVQLVTHLPKGMQFVSANNMGEYDSSSHSVHWSLAELPASERGTVELIALPTEPGAQTLQVATKARQGLEDRTDKRVLVEGLSALMFEVEDVEGLIEIGGETTYEIRVRNQGSKAAANVQVVAIMPPGIRPISGQGETRHAIQGERVVFAPLPQLAPKSDTTFRIQAQGVRPGDQRVRVQISADDLQQPITKEVSTKVYADE